MFVNKLFAQKQKSVYYRLVDRKELSYIKESNFLDYSLNTEKFLYCAVCFNSCDIYKKSDYVEFKVFGSRSKKVEK